MTTQYSKALIYKICILIYVLSLLMLWVFPANYYLLIAMRFVQGISGAFVVTVLSIHLASIVNTKQMSESISLFTLAITLPSIFTPAVVMLMMDYFGNAQFFLIPFFMSLFLVISTFYSINDKAVKKEISEETLIENPTMIFFLCCVTMIFVNFVSGGMLSFFPLYLKEGGLYDPKLYFLVQASSLCFSRFAFRKYLNVLENMSVLLLAVPFLLFAGSLLLFLFMQNNLFLILLSIFSGILFGIVYPSLMTVVATLSPEKNKGFNMGVYIGSADLGVMLGSLLIGLCIDYFGYGNTFVAMSVVGLTGFLATIITFSIILKRRALS